MVERSMYTSLFLMKKETESTARQKKGEIYPADSITGTGKIQGQTVRCISPEWMVKFHSGYQLKEKDFRDVYALCSKFGIALPVAYKHFKKRLEPS